MDDISICVKRKFLSTKITACCFIDDLLFTGESIYLHVYQCKSRKELLKLQLFKASTIHGIREWKNILHEDVLGMKRLIVWGQKSLCFMHYQTQSFKCLYKSEEYLVTDWIIDIVGEDREEFSILALAHNELLRIKWPNRTFSVVEDNHNEISPPGQITLPDIYIYARKQCSEISLLYCGQIVGNSWSECVLIAGSAFGSIVIWVPGLSFDDRLVTPLHIITGHKGAVFCVAYDVNSNCIASISDDRSLKTWKITCSTSWQQSCPNPHNDSKMSEKLQFWTDCTIRESSSMYGHSSRVWRVHFLTDSRIITAGEDSIICVWSQCGQLLHSWVAHSNSTIWALASNERYVASGSSDGSVKLWPYFNDIQAREIFSQGNRQYVISNKSIYEESTIQSDDKEIATKTCNDFTRTVNMINGNRLCLVKNSGSINILDFKTNESKSKYLNKSLENYSISCFSKNSKIFVIGCLTGSIFIHGTDTFGLLAEEKIFSEKVQAIHCLNSNTFLLSNSKGLLSLISVKYDLELSENIEVTELGTHQLPKCKQHWSTCGVIVNPAQYLLIVGDTSGKIHIFKKKDKHWNTLMTDLE